MTSNETLKQHVGPRLIRPRIELYREGSVYGRIAAGQVTVYPQGIPKEELAQLQKQSSRIAGTERLEWNELDADWFAEQRTFGPSPGSPERGPRARSKPALLQLRADQVLVGPAEEASGQASGTEKENSSGSLALTERGGLNLSRQIVLLRGRVVLQAGDAAIRSNIMLLDMPRGNVWAAGPVICRWGAYQNPPPQEDAPVASMPPEWSPSGGTLVAERCSYDLERRSFVCDRVAGALRIQRHEGTRDDFLFRALSAADDITALGLPSDRSLSRRLKDGEPQGAGGWSARLEAGIGRQPQHSFASLADPDTPAQRAANKDTSADASAAAYDHEAAHLRIRAERMQLRLDAARVREWIAERLSLAEAIHFSDRTLYDNQLEWDPSGPKHPGIRLEAKQARWRDRRRRLQGPDLRLERALLHLNKRLALPVLQRSLNLGQGGSLPLALEQLLSQGHNMTRFAYDVEKHGGAYLEWPLWTASWQGPADSQVRADVDLVSRLAASIPFTRRWMLRGSLEMLHLKAIPWNVDIAMQLDIEQPPAPARRMRPAPPQHPDDISSARDQSALTVSSTPFGQGANGSISPGAMETDARQHTRNVESRPLYRETTMASILHDSNDSARDTGRAHRGQHRLDDYLGGHGHLKVDLSGGRSILVSFRSQEAAFHPLLQFEPLAGLDVAPWPVTRNRPWTRLRRHWQAQGTLWQRRRVSHPDPHARVLESVNVVYERMGAAVLPTTVASLAAPSSLAAVEDDRVQRLAFRYQVQVENLLYAGRRTRRQRTRPYVAGFAALDARLERTQWSRDREPWTLRGALVGGLRAQLGRFQQRVFDSTGLFFRVRQAFGVPSPLLHHYEGLPTSVHMGFVQQLLGPLRFACERVWLYRSGFTAAASAKEMLLPLETSYVVEWQQPTFKMSMGWNVERQQGHLRAVIAW
ncbi:hypothetical protein CCYA_CCYA11G3206 [Cyanidiococcus yangmingshanensis]|nr:hypothetical protein CCYA_CCYA11G3206 [Cyanidiococcus yangmingshanensis]